MSDELNKLDKDHLEQEKLRSEATDILEEITPIDLDMLRSAGWDNAADFVADMQDKLAKYGEQLRVTTAQLQWLENIRNNIQED